MSWQFIPQFTVLLVGQGVALKVTVTLPWSSCWVFLRGYHRVLVVAYRGKFRGYNYIHVAVCQVLIPTDISFTIIMRGLGYFAFMVLVHFTLLSHHNRVAI